MERPKKADYKIKFCSENNYKRIDYAQYSIDLSKYANYLESKVKTLGLFSVVPSISSKYDCDDCKYFPCHSNQDNQEVKANQLNGGYVETTA